MKQHNKAVLGLLVLLVLASVIYLLTVYTDTFGERDSYRMLLVMISST